MKFIFLYIFIIVSVFLSWEFLSCKFLCLIIIRHIDTIIICLRGGTGRRNGLKIHRLTAMPVRFRPQAPYRNNRIDTNISSFFIFKGYFACFRHKSIKFWRNRSFFFALFDRGIFMKSTNQ